MTNRALWPPQPFERMHKQAVAVAVTVEFLLLLEIRPLPLLLLLTFEIRSLSFSVSRNSPLPQRRNNSPIPLSLLQNIINHDHRYIIVQRIQCPTLIIKEFSKINIKVKIKVSRLVQSYVL